MKKLLACLMLLLVGCSYGPPVVQKAVGQAAPLAAIAVTCKEGDQGLLVMFIQTDATHMLRFSMKQTALLTPGAAGETIEKIGSPVDSAKVLELAKTAAVQTRVEVPCGPPGLSA